MMRLFLMPALLFASIACAPPPAVEVGSTEPLLSIVHPSGTTENYVDSDGIWRQWIGIYIENFEFLPPGSADTHVDGQGHFHIDVNNKPTPYAYELGTLLEITGLAEDDPVLIKVYLVQNDHLPVVGDNVLDIVEMQVGPTPPDETTDTGE